MKSGYEILPNNSGISPKNMKREQIIFNEINIKNVKNTGEESFIFIKKYNISVFLQFSFLIIYNTTCLREILIRIFYWKNIPKIIINIQMKI